MTRIIWGEKPSGVIGYLAQNGYQVKAAERLVSVFLKERYKIVRRRGVRRVVIGVTVVSICAWALAAMFPIENSNNAFDDGEAIAFLVMLFFWGLWKLMDGLRDLWRTKLISGDLGFHGEQF